MDDAGNPSTPASKVPVAAAHNSHAAHLIRRAAAAELTPAERMRMGLTYQSPVLEEAYQASQTKPRLQVWAVMLAQWAILFMVHATSVLMELDDPTRWFSPSAAVGFYCGIMTVGSLMILLWDSDSKLTHFLVRVMNEIGWLVVGLLAVMFVSNKCYSSEPPSSEEIQMITFTWVSRPFFMVWTAASPQVNIITTLVPILILLNSPHTTRLMAYSLSMSTVYIHCVTYLIYRHTRVRFLDQVELHHSQIVTAKLKQEQEESNAELRNLNNKLHRRTIELEEASRRAETGAQPTAPAIHSPRR